MNIKYFHWVSFSVSEGSETRLPKPGGEEVDVRVSFIMESGDIYVRKEGEVKDGEKEVTLPYNAKY